MSMRERFIVLSMLFTAAGISPAVGQFGIKAGLSLSGIDSEEYTPLLGYEVEWMQDKDALPQFGLQLGGFYTHALGNHVAVQPELHLVRRGVDFFRTQLYDTSLRVHVYYIQVPVLLRYRMILFGPYTAIKLASRRSLTIGDDTNRRDLPSVAALDYGLTLAFSPTFSIRSQPILFELRFELGLANITDPAMGATELYLDSGRTRVLGIVLLTGIRF